MERESQHPPPPPTRRHIPLKSKCRGTSPGRSSSVAQRLGRQAVTGPGRGPARLARPLPPRLDRQEPRTAEHRARNGSGGRHRGRVTLQRRVEGHLRCLTAPPAPRLLDGGPAESAADDNPHLATGPRCLRGLCGSTHPHGNSGRASHSM